MRPGTLLISQPFLGDPNFERSVVLLCRDEADDGSFGLVLNRLTNLTLGDVLDLPAASVVPLSLTLFTFFIARPTCRVPRAWARKCIGAEILNYCSALSEAEPWQPMKYDCLPVIRGGRRANWQARCRGRVGYGTPQAPGKCLLWHLMPFGGIFCGRKVGALRCWPIIR
jgi:hypothetical protein